MTTSVFDCLIVFLLLFAWLLGFLDRWISFLFACSLIARLLAGCLVYLFVVFYFVLFCFRCLSICLIGWLSVNVLVYFCFSFVSMFDFLWLFALRSGPEGLSEAPPDGPFAWRYWSVLWQPQQIYGAVWQTLPAHCWFRGHYSAVAWSVASIIRTWSVCGEIGPVQGLESWITLLKYWKFPETTHLQSNQLANKPVAI